MRDFRPKQGASRHFGLASCRHVTKAIHLRTGLSCCRPYLFNHNVLTSPSNSFQDDNLLLEKVPENQDSRSSCAPGLTIFCEHSTTRVLNDGYGTACG